MTSGILYELVGPLSAKFAIFKCSQIDPRYLPKTPTPIENYIKEIGQQKKQKTMRKNNLAKIKIPEEIIPKQPTPLETTLDNDMLESEFANTTTKEILQEQSLSQTEPTEKE